MLAADGCTLVGGHSAEAAEPALGFAVTGLADPAKLLRKAGLRPGDALVLTKPLGTGIVLAGHMRGLARARVAAGGDRIHADEQRRRRRASCASSARRRAPTSPASASPDICWRCCARPVSPRCCGRDQLPALPGALELAAHGVAEHAGAGEPPPAARRRASTPRAALLFDPQTSGGLLAGIARDRAEACVAALRSQGIAATIVGVVEQGQVAVRLAAVLPRRSGQ